MPVQHILILGGGIAGVAAALAITRDNKIRCSVFEIRPVLSTIGGAVNLTPNALRYLDHLGVLEKLLQRSCEVLRIDIFALRTGNKICEIDFDHADKFKFRARRVLRYDLLHAMMETLEEPGGIIEYGKKAVSISHEPNCVKISFEDGSDVEGDILLGCDGIHSFVRTAIVEPERKPVYSGIANAYCMLDTNKLSSTLPFEATGMYSGRNGSLMMSYYDSKKAKLYAAAVMETEAAQSREGWKVKGEDRESVRKNILHRFGDSPEPVVADVIRSADEWFLYPVYRLPPKGKWSEQRCLLIGDAAHAMPPQGESVGLTLEDVMLFSRLLEAHDSLTIPKLFSDYEGLRRTRIDFAVAEANFRWETVKDKGWLAGIIMEWLTVLILWWTKQERVESYAYDVRDLILPGKK